MVERAFDSRQRLKSNSTIRCVHILRAQPAGEIRVHRRFEGGVQVAATPELIIELQHHKAVDERERAAQCRE